MMSLAAREAEVLRHLAEHRYLNRGQIEELLFGGSAITPDSRRVITWRVLSRLKQAGLVTTNALLEGEPSGAPTRIAYFLTSFGRRRFSALEPDFPERRPVLRGTFLIAHALMVADTALAFRRSARSHPGHRVLLWECDWRTAALLGPNAVLPDARLIYGVDEWQIHAFIEADRGSERSRFFERKIARYLDLYRRGTWRNHMPVWPVVLTATPSEHRATELRRTTERLLSTQSEGTWIAKAFRFGALDEICRAPGPLSEIWQVAARTGRHPLSDAVGRLDASADEPRSAAVPP
jgi:hypothetical protein